MMKKSDNIRLYTLILIGFVIFLASSCNDKDQTVPILTTAAISNNTDSTATCGGNITGGCSKVSKRGVCWSLRGAPSVGDNKTIDGSGQGSFISSLTGLIADTTYYVRAYATNCIGTGYGNVVTFTTVH